MLIRTPAARAALFASTALISLTVAAPARAQAEVAAAPAAAAQGPSDFISPVAPEAYSTGFVRPTLPAPHQLPASVLAPAPDVQPEPQIVIANPGTSTTSRDPTNITGIGQMVVDQQNGFIGLCSGTLINPRAVLFAAHCVNSRAATAYGANSGGMPISFGFQTDNLPGLQRWFNATIGGQPNAQRYQSNPALALYNVSQVRYNELSLEAASRSFLYGDVAIATLDTPAAGIPTWALLFSPLAAPSSITAAGTGYNVQLVGYGSHGNATTGSASGSDFRRRIAENVLGALTDLKTFETFIFGSSTSPTQNLYFLDFDDPRRGQSGASTFDFNAFRDNARGTNEGITAAGDSGGPLILQNVFNMQVAIGVLSGGYTRFFNGQPANGYGTVSFYQPIYLYWDWIAANNPYRYVSNIAGDRRWADATNWVTTTDPNYMIIGPDGQLVNGVPNDPGAQKNGTGGQFGEMCIQGPSTGRPQGGTRCRDAATGQERIVSNPIGTDAAGAPEGGSATQGSDTITASVAGWAEGVVPEAQASGGATTQALPPATIANGLPGATNFVPNNVDPVRATGAIGRYFDVSLAAAGTTTLDTVVTIDRFRITAAGARLNVTSAGQLTSLIDVNQLTGTAHVDGRLISRGDYLLMSGVLSGNGTVRAPFVTSVLGTVAPGSLGTIGTLTIEGNLVMSSGSSLNIDIGESGFNDRLVLAANGSSTGTAGLAGALTLNPVVRPRYNNQYHVLSAAGGVTGTFGSVTDLPGVLFPVVTYGANRVDLRIDAASFHTLIDPNSRTQVAFANLLDANRVNYGALSDVYYELDVLEGTALRQAFNSMAPGAAVTVGYLGMMGTESMARFYRDRIGFVQSGAADGQLSLIGNPIQFAALDRSGLNPLEAGVQSDAGGVGTVAAPLPDGVSAFIAAGYLDGSSAPLDGNVRDHVDGWFAAAGVEMTAGDSSRIGAAVHFVNADGESGTAQRAGGDLYQVTAYGSTALSRVNIHGQLSIGLFETDTRRQVALGSSTSDLRADTAGLAFSGEVGIGMPIAMQRLTLTPNGSIRYSHIEHGGFNETGGAGALTLSDEEIESLQGRFGLDLGGELGANGTSIVPRLTAAYVHEFLDNGDAIQVGFAGSGFGGTTVPFFRPLTDRDWGEFGIGIRVGSDRMSFDLSAETTIERSDLRQQTYRAGISFRF